jgi:hypothetical protein
MKHHKQKTESRQIVNKMAGIKRNAAVSIGKYSSEGSNVE